MAKQNDDRLPWFPCEPSKLLGALGAMKPHVGYTYWIICLRHYEIGGPVTDSLDAIARRTGYNKRVVSDAIDVLFRSGKLVRDPAGIVNPYAAKVLGDMQVRRGRLSQSGREGASRKWGKGEQKQQTTDGEAMPTLMGFDAQGQLQEQEQGKAEAASPGRRRAPRRVIDPNWIPDVRDVLYAKSKGFDEPRIRRQIGVAFVRHHRSRGTLIADLYATWQTWVDNEVKFEAERAARNAPQRGPSMFEIASGAHKEGR